MIDTKNISVEYRSGERIIPALHSIDLNISKGEYLSILGPNGSGKSTLIKALCGLVPLSQGAIEIDGLGLRPGDFPEQLFGNMGVVFQEPSGQFLMPTVGKEIETALQNLGLNHDRQKDRFEDIVARFELPNILQISPENLSPGQMQLVNLAVAFAMASDILLLDEPTTFLDLNSRAAFLEKLNEINAEGVTVIHVTQYPDEALLSRRTAILVDGSIMAEGSPEELLSNESLLKQSRLKLPTQLEFENHFGFVIDDSEAVDKFIGTAAKVKTSDSEALNIKSAIVSAKNVSFSYTDSPFSLKIDNLDLYKDQVVGLVGLSGSGKSTLALLLAGIIKPLSGEIKYCQLESSPATGIRYPSIGLGWQMPDPVLIGPTVEDDLKISLAASQLKNAEFERLLRNVGLEGFESRIVDTLSGGEKRKLSLASIIANNPDYLILDEPAAFLDPVSQLELNETIRKILINMKGGILIGHDLPFLSDLVERIIGLREGRIEFDVPARDFFSDPEYSRRLGLPPDEIILFRQKLVNAGIELESNTLYPAELSECLYKRRETGDNFS